MRRRVAVFAGLMMTGAALVCGDAARAQMPVCPNPSPTDAYYSACVPGGRTLVARILFDLAVDHLLKSDTDPVTRRPAELLRLTASQETLDQNADLIAYLEKLPPLHFTKIDTTTGILGLEIADDARRFDGTIGVGKKTYPLSMELPARLSGGYWRTPDVLQIAFWNRQRASIHADVPGSGRFDAEIECLVVSTDGLRVVTTGTDVPDVLVRFDGCE